MVPYWLAHPQELHRLSQEDNPDTTQHWGEATDLVCSFMKASFCRGSNGAHNISDQDNIFFPWLTRLKNFEKTFRQGLQSRQKKPMQTHIHLFRKDKCYSLNPQNAKLLETWEEARWRKSLHNLRTKLNYEQVPDAKHLGVEGRSCIQFNPHSKQICAI